MALVHKKSQPCSIQQLELFQPLVTCNQVIKSQCVPHYAINGSDSGTNIIEFLVQGSGDQYIDLYNTKLYLKCKLVKGDGNPYNHTTTDLDVYPIVNPIATIFQQCDLILNDKLVTGSNNLYPYRAYMDMITNYRKDTLDSISSSQLFYLDSPGTHDSYTGNEGAVIRKDYIKNSREFEIEGPLFTDITSQGRYLLNHVDVRVRLSRSSDKFCLMDMAAAASISNPQLKIVSAILKVQKVTLNPNAQLAIEQNLRKNNAIYNILRQEPKSFTIASGQTTFSREHISLGLSPKYAIIGLVDTEAVQGTYKMNPFKFDNFHVKRISLNVDGEEVPLNGINVGYGEVQEKHNCLEGFNSIVDVTNRWRSDHALAFDREMYQGGNVLYGFEIAPEIVPGAFNTVRNTNIRLDISFSKALLKNITVLIFFYYDSVIEINANREVFMDYGN